MYLCMGACVCVCCQYVRVCERVSLRAGLVDAVGAFVCLHSAFVRLCSVFVCLCGTCSKIMGWRPGVGMHVCPVYLSSPFCQTLQRFFTQSNQVTCGY